MSEGEEVKRRRRRSRQEIRRLVAEFRTSGLRASEFCRTHGFTHGTLQRGLRRERIACGSQGAVKGLVAVEVSNGDGLGARIPQESRWQYSHPMGPVVFDFRLGREREGPKRFLGTFEGILQSDGYGAYDRVGGPAMVHAACWAHARRKFFDAVKLNPKDQTTIGIVALMDQLFAIDAQARAQKLTRTDRHLLRQQKAPPLLEQIKGAIEAARVQVLPSSALAKACNYTLTLWGRLTRFLDYPQLELSNNLSENAIRRLALGRKNWIHIGSEQAGPRVAAPNAFGVESCGRLNIPLRDYLGSVLPGLANRPISQLGELTPAAWANRKMSAKAPTSSAA